ncbi:DUF6461 domain-containing protein [Lentzea sp. BCCO 10_0856]|uniref:DUF6461 domain-containing protein n=1 Tax=Lentzea miocenica TaxID=3095431 RepID=A0ABU4SSK5_9PSEU|nr:DUF6461 domain-containing protein [Lentzea sp. BCCO 10_0856]MDX8028875.1 DUF6461 domain-containing protein [Lentzea sp. BCCO 10_0856]
MRDHSWADAHPGEQPFLGEIFSLAFVRDVEPLEAMRRIGGLPDTLAERTPEQICALRNFDDGYPEVVCALALGEWMVLVQPTGFWLAHLTVALSRGTEAVSLSRHDYATSSFNHAVDGTLVGGFDVNYPPVHYGADTERLLGLMREAGFDPDDEEGEHDAGISGALRLAELITGVAPTFGQLVAPLPSMHFDHWFSRHRPSGSPSEHTAEEIIAELDLARTPGLVETLAAARRGEHVVVTPESELGQHVREWSTLSRRASRSLNSARGRMSDQERARGHRFGWLLQELSFAFRPDLAWCRGPKQAA